MKLSTEVCQNYHLYTEEDHSTWAELCHRQVKLRKGAVSTEYLKGFEEMQLHSERIVDIDELSGRLQQVSGWTLIPVTGLIPTKEFFYMLINKKYPVTISIRKPHEVDFSEQPDIFHDVLGHLPLLTNEKFYRFLTAFSIIALKYVNNERAVEFLGRLYWYTYEMGVINEGGELRPYGGAIITSEEEVTHMRNDATPKHAFDIDHIFRTPYNPFRLQDQYFVINSFDDLFTCLEHLEEKLIANLLLREEDLSIRNYSYNPALAGGFNNVIGFLNDTQFKFPDAIPFIAGQPDERFFQIEDHIAEFNTFVDHLVARTGKDRINVVNSLGQYGKTKGIINDILAEYLRRDEDIHVTQDDILVTVGAQEAFAVITTAICDREKDVILVEDPSYIGLSSFAKIFGYKLCGIPTDEEGVNLDELKRRIIEINSSGKRVKLLYLIPDYQNPTGSCIPIGNRLKLLELAQRYNFLIIEDSVYNSFTYTQKKNPTLKSLDKYKRVIYVGSFSKSLFPGLRIGLIAANQHVENPAGELVPLIDIMANVKAQLTNNTPTLSQAVVGGVLLSHNMSMAEWSQPKFDSYRNKRNAMVDSLRTHIGSFAGSWAADIHWNEPDGGFFIKMSLPFTIDQNDVVECACSFGVIFCPMRYFYLNKGGEQEIRLTFSNLNMENIGIGVQRLAAYLRYRMEGKKKAERFETEVQYN